MTRRQFGLRIALLLTCIAAANPLVAQETLARLASYEGADRATRIEANARKEGELNLYTSLGTEDVAALSAVFEKKYGVKIKLWRASSEKMLQRIITESQGGRNDFDIVETISPELETPSREKLLQAVNSVFHADLLQQAVPAHNYDFMLSEGAIRFLDPAAVIDQQAKWSKLYDEIIVKQSR